MCLPLAALPLVFMAASAALGVGSAVAGYVGQKEAYKANLSAANANAANAFNVREQNRVEGDQKNAEDRLSLIVEGAQNFGKIAQSASVLGYGPATTQAALSASAVATGRATGINAQNFLFQRSQYQNDLQGDQLQRVSQINQVQAPSAASLVLGIGKAVVGAGSDYYTMTNMKGKT